MPGRDAPGPMIRTRMLATLACACAGGFVASTLGFYLGAFPGMDLAGAAVAGAAGAWVEFR